MPRYGQARHNLPLLIGLSATAVLTGAGMSTLSESGVVPVVAVALATILFVVLAASVAPGALAKIRNLAAGFRWWHGLWFCVGPHIPRAGHRYDS